MPNSPESHAAIIAAIRQQITGIVDDHHELSDVVGRLAGEMRQGFSAIHAKLDAQTTPKWGVIFTGLSLILGVFVALGTLAYMPIKNDIETVKATQARNYEQLVVRDQRIWDEVIKNARSLSYLDGQLHPLK